MEEKIIALYDLTKNLSLGLENKTVSKAIDLEKVLISIQENSKEKFTSVVKDNQPVSLKKDLYLAIFMYWVECSYSNILKEKPIRPLRTVINIFKQWKGRCVHSFSGFKIDVDYQKIKKMIMVLIVVNIVIYWIDTYNIV